MGLIGGQSYPMSGVLDPGIVFVFLAMITIRAIKENQHCISVWIACQSLSGQRYGTILSDEK